MNLAHQKECCSKQKTSSLTTQRSALRYKSGVTTLVAKAFGTSRNSSTLSGRPPGIVIDLRPRHFFTAGWRFDRRHTVSPYGRLRSFLRQAPVVPTCCVPSGLAIESGDSRNGNPSYPAVSVPADQMHVCPAQGRFRYSVSWIWAMHRLSKSRVAWRCTPNGRLVYTPSWQVAHQRPGLVLADCYCGMYREHRGNVVKRLHAHQPNRVGQRSALAIAAGVEGRRERSIGRSRLKPMKTMTSSIRAKLMT